MDSDYLDRDGLLPEGCKDLMDAIKQRACDIFLIEMPMPEVRKKDIEVTVKGRRLIVAAKPLGYKAPVKMTIEVPVGYSPDEALVFYFQDRLQIAVRRSKAA